jgi:peptide/nickel transport system substrate-binding protein
MSKDGLTYTFHLRQGVKFQNRPPVNGRELVADDVKYSLEQIRDTPGSQQAWKFAIVEKIETPDKYTVVVRLKEPRASFLLYLGDPYSEITAKETDLPGEGRAKWYTAVGAGPFEIVSEIPDVGQVYRKNPTYYRANEGLPHLDELRRMIISDDATTLAAFRAGQIDIRAISRLDLDSVRSTNPDIHCEEGEVSSATLGITVRMDKPPYNDIRVRQAIALAFNDQAVIDGNYLGYGIEQRGPINVAHPYYLEDQGECNKYYQYNLAEAKRLLTEAGYPNGFKDILNSTPGYGTTVVEYGEIVIDQMKQVGITLEYKLREYGSHVSTALQGKYDGMFWGYFYGSSFDPDDWLIAPFTPFTEAGGKNQAHVDDPKVLDMIMAQAKARNEEERRAILNDIQRYLACQQYYIFWPRSYGVTCMQPWVDGYRVHSAFYSAGRILEQVWMSPDAPSRKLALTKDAFPYDKFKK